MLWSVCSCTVLYWVWRRAIGLASPHGARESRHQAASVPHLVPRLIALLQPPEQPAEVGSAASREDSQRTRTLRDHVTHERALRRFRCCLRRYKWLNALHGRNRRNL